MSEYKNLYFPLFYEAIESAEPISDEDFGKIIRAASRKLRGEEAVGELSSELQVISNMIVRSAERVFEGSRAQNSPSQRGRRQGMKLDPEKELWVKHGFEKAIERSYGKGARADFGT